MKWQGREESKNVEYDCLGVRTQNYDLAASCWADLKQQKQDFIAAAMKANAPSEEVAESIFGMKLQQIILQNGVTGSATETQAQGMLDNFELTDAIQMDARLTDLKSATNAIFTELTGDRQQSDRSQTDDRVQRPPGPAPSEGR